MATLFSLQDRARIRMHLGYPSVELAASVQLGLPSATQPLYLVENAMDLVLPEAADQIRQTVEVMDSILAQLVDANRRLKAMSVDEITLRTGTDPTEQDKLWEQYGNWATILSDQLGAPINPFSARFRTLGLAGYGVSGLIPVIHPGR
jgi:hypothetical protein